jgi:hypothetical protein
MSSFRGDGPIWYFMWESLKWAESIVLKPKSHLQFMEAQRCIVMSKFESKTIFFYFFDMSTQEEEKNSN